MRPASPFHVGPVNSSPVNVWHASQPNFSESALPWAMSAGVNATVMFAYGLAAVPPPAEAAFTVPRISPLGFAFVWTLHVRLAGDHRGGRDSGDRLRRAASRTAGPAQRNDDLAGLPRRAEVDVRCERGSGQVRKGQLPGEGRLRRADDLERGLERPGAARRPLRAAAPRASCSWSCLILYEPGVSLVACRLAPAPESPAVANPAAMPTTTLVAAAMTMTLSLLFMRDPSVSVVAFSVCRSAPARLLGAQQSTVPDRDGWERRHEARRSHVPVDSR